MRSATGTKSGGALLRDLFDEGDDGLLGWAVVPGWQRIGGASNGGGESQRANERGAGEVR